MSAQPPVPPTAEGSPIDPAWPPPFPEDVPDPREERRRLVAREAGTILAVFFVLGVACGVAWLLLVDPAQKVRVEGGVAQDEIQLARMFGYDGWYAVLAAPVALITGLVLTHRLSRDPLATLLLVLAGCALAAGVMELTGYLLGPADPDVVLANEPIGATADVQMTVSGFATYLAWPIPTLLGALVSLLSHTDHTD